MRKPTIHAKGVGQSRKATIDNPAYKAQKHTFCFFIFFFSVLALLETFF